MVEGDEDQRFVETIIRPLFGTRFISMPILTYAKMSPRELERLIRSIKELGHDYIVLGDFDNGPCKEERKNAIVKKGGIISREKIIIVVKEIEGWYLAGLDSRESKKLGVEVLSGTDYVTKEKFDELRMRRPNPSRQNFMIEILNRFDVQIAKTKNTSFGYFLRKFNLV